MVSVYLGKENKLFLGQVVRPALKDLQYLRSALDLLHKLKLTQKESSHIANRCVRSTWYEAYVHRESVSFSNNRVASAGSSRHILLNFVHSLE